MDIDGLIERHRLLLREAGSATSEHIIEQGQRVLIRALFDGDQSIEEVATAAQEIIKAFHTDLTRRYVQPEEPCQICLAVSAAVLAVVPAASIIGPSEAATILGIHRQSIGARERSAGWPLTPLWRNGHRAFIRAEVVALRDGGASPAPRRKRHWPLRIAR